MSPEKLAQLQESHDRFLKEGGKELHKFYREQKGLPT